MATRTTSACGARRCSNGARSRYLRPARAWWLGSRVVVEAHGGDITVESKVGEGTTFVVSLPVEAAGVRRKRDGAAHVEDVR